MSANDIPFKKGDLVNVVRARHGWYDGRATAFIKTVYKNDQGTYSYVAVGVGEYKECVFELKHTRDAFKTERL